MDSYVRVFDEHERAKGDNPTIGLILCAKKNAAVAHYSVLSEGRQIFAARYMQVLPSEEQLAQPLLAVYWCVGSRADMSCRVH